MISATECGLVGLDVSKWQRHDVPWRALQNDHAVRFGIVKATNGAYGVDEQFETNKRVIFTETDPARFSFGAYSWFLPQQNPIAQARKLVRVVRASGELRDTDLGYALDFEDLGDKSILGDALLERFLVYAREVRRCSGRLPLVYSADWFWKLIGNPDSEEIAGYPLWNAEYPSTRRDTRPYVDAVCALPSDPYRPLPRPWQSRGIKEVVWQFDGDGGLYLPNGVDVDVNRFRGGEREFRAFVESTHLGAPLPTLLLGDEFEVQRALKELGFDLGTSGTNRDGVDGDHGRLTRAALRAVQQAHGLPQTELADDATLEALQRARDDVRRVTPASFDLVPDSVWHPNLTARAAIRDALGVELPSNDDEPPPSAA